MANKNPLRGDTFVNKVREVIHLRAPIKRRDIVAAVNAEYGKVTSTLSYLKKQGEIRLTESGYFMPAALRLSGILDDKGQKVYWYVDQPRPIEVQTPQGTIPLWEAEYIEAVLAGVKAARRAYHLQDAYDIKPSEPLKQLLEEAQEEAVDNILPRAFNTVRVPEFAGIPAFEMHLQDEVEILKDGVRLVWRVEKPPTGFRDKEWWGRLCIVADVIEDPGKPRWEWGVYFPNIGDGDAAFTAHVYRAMLSLYKRPQYHRWAGPHGDTVEALLVRRI